MRSNPYLMYHHTCVRPSVRKVKILPLHMAHHIPISPHVAPRQGYAVSALKVLVVILQHSAQLKGHKDVDSVDNACQGAGAGEGVVSGASGW